MVGNTALDAATAPSYSEDRELLGHNQKRRNQAMQGVWFLIIDEATGDSQFANVWVVEGG